MGFFEEVRRVVRGIPRGKVATYGEVARAAGYPRRARMVARALSDSERYGLPWQRVIGAGGGILLTGEAGLRQRLLLELEGVAFRGRRVWMARHAHIPADTSPPKAATPAVPECGRHGATPGDGRPPRRRPVL